MKMTKRPPVTLSAEGKRLWADLIRGYSITDPAGLRLLLTACESLDLMRRAEAEVNRDGMTVKDRYGAIRGHPMLGTIRDARHAMLQALRHLNLDIEPLQERIGRPTGR